MEDNSITASSSMPCLGQGLQLRVDFASTVTPGNSLNQPSGIYYSSPLRRFCMPEAPRITVEELKRRMEAGEDFTLIDVRKPEAWTESDTVIPEAIRVPLDKLEENLSRIPRTGPWWRTVR